MATSGIRQTNYRFEHLFFSGMALVILAFVFVGFAPSYYLAGVFKAPLPNLLVHIHGAAFSLWILSLITQTSLVAVGRVDLHRRLGLLGFGLACLMVVMGVLVATDSLIRHASNGERVTAIRAFYATPLGAMLMFGTLIYFAFRNRFKPAAHKRLILIATLALLDAALDRWPIQGDWWTNRMANLVACYPFLLLLVVYDWSSRKKIQSATLWGGVFLVAVQQIRPLIGHTAAFQTFAAWIQIHGRSFL